MSVKITYFVHGTTTDNQEHLSSGWKDVSLSDLGIKQSEELKEQTKDKKFDVVFCSDLKRAIDSAKITWEGVYPIVIDARLRECNYGKLNGASSDIVEKMQEDECLEKPFPEGESYEDVKARIADFLKFLKKNYDGKSVAIVAHKAPQIALDVLLKNKTWKQALATDWRKTKSWKPGWEYEINDDEELFNSIFLELPEELKRCASDGSDIGEWSRDYLSKQRNIQKYVFGACEQIQIFGIGYQKYIRELSQYSSKDLQGKSAYIVVRSFEKEARLLLRQALELFMESWNFKSLNNKENAIRSYFLLRTLQAFYNRNFNSITYFDFPRKWDQKVIKEIKEVLIASDFNYFFLNKDRKLQKDSDIPYLRKSYSELLRESLQKMSARERVAVDESYQIYAETSDVIHGYSGSIKFKFDDAHKELKLLYVRIAIISLHILKTLSEIGRETLKCPEILNALDTLETEELGDSLEIKEGDLVRVKKEVKAKVVKVDTSNYGGKKYQVEFCDKRGDWDFGFAENTFLRNDLEKIEHID